MVPLGRLARLSCIVAVVGSSMGGCRCDQSTSTDQGPRIETEKIVEKSPQAPRPEVVFPERWHSTDASVNAFVRQALQVCAEGDYDGFRQLFGTTYTPPDQAEFERVWYAVRQITVAGFYRGQQDPPEYYLHAVVQYRGPDRKGRTRRDAVVAIFQEAGQWRLAPAPTEVVRKVVAASTRPAHSPSAGDTRPAEPEVTLGVDAKAP